jgi:aerobic-type carbon monoxide dehydrogenase small subunit (CoxS/CutS family)
MTTTLQFSLNGRPTTVQTEPGRSLLSVLRAELGLTGTKYGCGEGLCGACTVQLDGREVRACVTPAASVAGRQVLTVEGLAAGGTLHPLQQAFIDHGAFQCGYCTPGMLMSAHALLREHPAPTREAIVERLDHHLCRCGAYQRIVRAIESVAQTPRQGQQG